MARRIGIYSGTFDPVHPGHVTFALEATRVCKLDEVVFLPEQTPRGKHNVTEIGHRIAIIERATQGLAGLRVVRLASQQFSVKDTLPELRAMFADAQFTLLVGSDVVQTFLYRWEGLDVLLGEVSLAIGLRINDNPDEVAAILVELERQYSKPIDTTLIYTQDADVASSHIRSGITDRSRLHPTVLDYMQEHGLYPSKI